MEDGPGEVGVAGFGVARLKGPSGVPDTPDAPETVRSGCDMTVGRAVGEMDTLGGFAGVVRLHEM